MVKTVIVICVLAACGGGGGGSTTDVDARCSLLNESYDAFSAAAGERCGEREGAGSCFEGDLCRGDEVCELVSMATEDAYCALLRATYSAFSSAGGARCGSGEGVGSCYPGDQCQQAGVCEAVLSAADGKPHAALFGQHYDAFSGASGPRCGSGDGSGSCLAGDRCVEAGVCALVLNGLGGQLQAERIGSQYSASASGDGPRCGEGEGSGSCKAGDRCVTPGTCEVVLSAWNR